MFVLLSLVEDPEFKDHDKAHQEEWKERMDNDEMVQRVWRKAQESKAGRPAEYWRWCVVVVVVAVCFLICLKSRSFIYRQLVKHGLISS